MDRVVRLTWSTSDGGERGGEDVPKSCEGSGAYEECERVDPALLDVPVHTHKQTHTVANKSDKIIIIMLTKDV